LSRRTLRTLALTIFLPVALLGHVAGAGAGPNPTVAGSVSNATSLSGAAYLAVSGNYAYTAAYYAGTLTVVDISNPAAPQVVGQSPFATSLLSASHLVISGSYAYVVSQNRNGASGTGSNDDGTGNSLTILDISVPTAPTIVGTLHNSNIMFGPHGVAVSGSYAYVAAQGCLNQQPCPNPNVGDSLVVIDISNPSNPTIAASIQNSNLPAPWTGSGALKHACSITISGNYAYVTASYSHRLTIIDISDPLHPTIVGSIQDGTRLPVPVDAAVKNGYAYVANETLGNGSVTVVDVHTPTSPQVVTSLVSPALNGAYRIRVRSNFAYIAATYASATAVLDISDPANPRLAASFASTALLNHTVGVDLDPTGQFAISTSPWLSTETRTLYPPFPLQPGGPSATGTVSAIALDPTPIGVSIGSAPASTTSATTALFAFSTSDAVSTVRCSLDGTPFGLCSTPTSQSYGSLAPGPHTFVVKAIDAADRSATATYNWTVTVSSAIDPSSLVLDNFNRANGSAGSKWSLIKSSGFALMNVSANTAVDSSTSLYAWNYWNAASFGPDVEAYATIATYAGDTIRIGARVTPGSSYSGYFVSITSAAAWSIIRIDNGGGPVTLASGVTQTLASGDKIGIRISGSVVTALHYTSAGWTQVLSYNTSQDAVRYTSPGSLAIEFRAGALDDFGGGTIAAPVNTQLPSVSGTVAVGQQLQASPGSWTGTPAPTFAYQWQDCDSGGNNCSPIQGATASSYTIQATDAGSTLKVVVTGSNSAGSSQATSAPTSLVAKPPTSPVLDNFNRANGGAGSKWTVIKSTGFALMNVSGNTAVDSSTTNYAWNYWNAASFGPDVEAYITVASYAGDTIRVGARVTPGTTYSGYFVSVSPTGGWSIIRIDNGGSPVTLASGVTQTVASGDKIGIRIVGSVVTALHYTSTGWTQALSYNTNSDSVRYTSAGRVAIEFRAGAFDDFGAGTI